MVENVLFISIDCSKDLFTLKWNVVNKRPMPKLCAPLAICFQLANSCTRWRSNFKGSYRVGDGRIFLKNLRASLFNDDLSNEITFSQIHLAGQYLLA
jgi:hypothetical protein